MAEWDVLDTGVNSAQANMRQDRELLEGAAELKRPVLHFYEWEKPSLTYGHFIDPSLFLNQKRVESLGWNAARRSTGGGIVFHLWDMAFSLVVPAHCLEYSMNTLDNYAFVNRAVLKAVEAFLPKGLDLHLIEHDTAPLDPHCSHFCMARPTKYDVLWQGKKIAGAAQRKTKAGFLHQGTIALISPSQELLEQVLLSSVQVSAAMQTYTYPLLEKGVTPEALVSAKQQLRDLLTHQLRNHST
jgi:lipoate-protein ligase A